MSVPAVIVPQASGSYIYNVASIGDDERIRDDIGNMINPDYASGLKWTPAQKSRVFAITTIALSVFGIGASIIAGITLGSTITFVAIPLSLAAGISIWYLATRKPDLDSPKDRAMVMKKIASLMPDAIIERTTQTYSVNKIVGYALLDRITNTPRSGAVGTARKVFYSNFAKLAEAYLSIKTQHRHKLFQIDSAYNAAVRDVSCWRNEQQRVINNRNMFASQVYTMAHNRRAYTEHENARSGAVLGPYRMASRAVGRGNASVAGVFEGAAAAASVAVQYHGAMTMQGVNHFFQEALAPAVRWRDAEKARANNAYSSAMNMLNIGQQYSTILAEFQQKNNQEITDERSLDTDHEYSALSGHPSTPPPPYRAAASAPPFSADGELP